MLARFMGWWARRARAAADEAMLRERGHVVRCPSCARTLNDHIDPIPASDAVYSYTCPCGARPRFDFSAPVPLLCK